MSCVTRTTFAMTDEGSQNTEGTTKQQVEKNFKTNYDIENIGNQAIKRYNEIDVQKMQITIAGDFSLHIGDIIFIDIGSLTEENKVDKFVGGKYMISDLCHRMDSNGVFTKLNTGNSPVTGSSSNSPTAGVNFDGSHDHTFSGTGTSTQAGGGAAHENRPPYYALCYIMKS